MGYSILIEYNNNIRKYLTDRGKRQFQTSSLDELELVALVLEPLQCQWQSNFKLIDTLERVVKSDDRAIAGVALDIVKNVLRCQPFGVVARD